VYIPDLETECKVNKSDSDKKANLEKFSKFAYIINQE